MTDSRVTPQAVQTAATQLRATHWNGMGCGTHGTSACSRCYGPSPADAAEVAEEVLAAAVPLLCQPLQDEIDRLRAQIEELTESRGTERLVHRLQENRLREDVGHAPRWEDDPIVIEHGWIDGRCARCGEALPVSPVATGGAE